MKFTLFAILAGSAAAFAPASNKASPLTALNALSLDGRPGALPPLGGWDPLGLATSEEIYDKFRSIELKHGRVAMLAVLGYVVPEFYRFPFDISPGLPCSEVPNGVKALATINPTGLVQIFFLIGFVDTRGVFGNYDVGKPTITGPTLLRRQTQELQNGRLAMLAAAELLRHDWQNSVQPGFDGMDNLITGLPFLYSN